MSALPDSDDFDGFDLMEMEKRLSFAVGYAFQRAYLVDDEFTRQLAILRNLLAKKQLKFQTFNIGDAANMFLSTAYRAAKTSHLIFDEAQIRIDNPQLYAKLMLVHHDLIDGVIHPLYNCMNYLSNPAVSGILGKNAKEIENCFTDAFGANFKLARNALAHEDDRMVLQDLVGASLVSRIERTQFRGTTGSGIYGLHIKNSDGDSFSVDFSENCFLKLLDTITKLVKK